ncbi:hypothetical protein FGG08_001216 [Glutinoglossum americanum]|uniref:Major facilitator superfamily (MFS) profile domain-containing protein n=1 Tax=Glutinoglossum americanum TaxID=1670608 RepID=A0A9P8I2I6_9PEZI|nr:hypothetical protein FGG08_001216 [Glutinoglossum americanum]
MSMVPRDMPEDAAAEVPLIRSSEEDERDEEGLVTHESDAHNLDDTGVISATLVSIRASLSSRRLTTLDKSLITASTSLFALLASPLAGWAADRWGRKRVILIADVLFVAGALWQAGAGTVGGMVAGRSVVGVAIGAASLVSPLYVSELAPAPYRGRLVVIQILLVTLGQVVAYTVGYLLSEQRGGWRWMVGLGALPAAVQGVVVGFLLPESPRWLVRVGKVGEARKVLRRVFGGGGAVVEGVVRGVEREVREEEGTEGLVGRWKTLVGERASRRALGIACFLQGLQQLCGFNSLMYFSATLFSLLSFRSPTLPALSIALTNLLFTFLAFLLIDRVGRRTLLLATIPVMALALSICAIAFGYITISSPAITTDSSDGSSDGSSEDVKPPKFTTILILLTLLLYVSAYALALGIIPWFQSELFPLSTRSLGSSLSTATNWSANFLVGISFLPMLEWTTPRVTFGGYAVVCLGGWVGVWWGFPEMGGVGLEDVREVVGGGKGVGSGGGGGGGREEEGEGEGG